METHDMQDLRSEQTRLLEILAEGIALSRQLLHMLDTERDALVDMDVAAIMRQVRAKEELLSSLQRLDHELAESMVRLGCVLQAGPAGLATLDPLFRADEARRFQAMRQEWEVLRQEIVANNLVNRRFIQETLAFLGDAMALFVDNGRREGYRAGGVRQRASADPCVFSREV
jgi:flagellar biosynthesis/type III secretory pathway chaperone